MGRTLLPWERGTPTPGRCTSEDSGSGFSAQAALNRLASERTTSVADIRILRILTTPCCISNTGSHLDWRFPTGNRRSPSTDMPEKHRTPGGHSNRGFLRKHISWTSGGIIARPAFAMEDKLH